MVISRSVPVSRIDPTPVVSISTFARTGIVVFRSIVPTTDVKASLRSSCFIVNFIICSFSHFTSYPADLDLGSAFLFWRDLCGLCSFRGLCLLFTFWPEEVGSLGFLTCSQVIQMLLSKGF